MGAFHSRGRRSRDTQLLAIQASAHQVAPLPLTLFIVFVLLLYGYMLHAHKRNQTPGELSLLVLYQQPSSILPYLTSFSSLPFFSALTWAQHLAVRYPLMTRDLTATIALYLLLLL